MSVCVCLCLRLLVCMIVWALAFMNVDFSEPYALPLCPMLVCEGLKPCCDSVSKCKYRRATRLRVRAPVNVACGRDSRLRLLVVNNNDMG